MKTTKNIILSAFTMLAFCVLFVNVSIVNAKEPLVNGRIYINYDHDVKGNIKEQKKIRIITYSDEAWSFDVRYGEGDRISNLKVSRKGLEARVTDTYDGLGYGSSNISVYATKPATYKVSFDVVNSNNVKRGHYTVQVQAVNTDYVIKKAVFGKQTVISNTGSIKKGVKKNSSKSSCKVKGKSGKLKITANSQYKITGIVVVSVGKNGRYEYKKFRNGKKLTLSKNYDAVSTNANWGGTRHSLKKCTYIYVSYKDKFFGDTMTYSISGARGRKEVKSVFKDAFSGERKTDYNCCPLYPDIELWQY